MWDRANAENEERPVAQALPAILTIADATIPSAAGIAAPMSCDVVSEPASRALAPVRQHFLKQDTVFSNVLVYSGCSAFRFPSARSDQVISN
jgi:hypothetical protein